MNLFFMIPGGAAAAYNLDGESISDSGALPIAGVRVNTDSTMDEQTSGGYSQIDAATDWVRPPTVIDHWCRFERISGDTGDFNGTLSTWLQCSGGSGSNREIFYDPAVATRTGVYSIEIATDSGGTDVVAGPVNYTLTATPS